MFDEIESPELRKFAGAMLLSVSLSTAVVVLVVMWFFNKYLAGPGNTTIVSTASGAADASSVDAAFQRQQQTIVRLDARCAELEGAVRDLKVRLGEPQVPVTYQASPGRLRYSD